MLLGLLEAYSPGDLLLLTSKCLHAQVLLTWSLTLQFLLELSKVLHFLSSQVGNLVINLLRLGLLCREQLLQERQSLVAKAPERRASKATPVRGMECCACKRQGKELPCLNPTYRRAEHPGRSRKIELRCQSRACHPAKHHGRKRQSKEPRCQSPTLRCQNPADHLRQTEEHRCQNPAGHPAETSSGTTMSGTKMKTW